MRIRGKEKEELSEMRRKNLLFLIEQYGSLAKLNAALGRKRNDSALAQIKYGSFNKEKKVPRRMGIALAREIEDKLNLPREWMDKEHPEKFPVPDEKIYGADTEQKIQRTDLVKIPLLELQQGSADGHYEPKLSGNIELPEVFFKNLTDIDVSEIQRGG